MSQERAARSAGRRRASGRSARWRARRVRFRELRIEGPVEVGERLDGDDAGLFEPSRKEAIGAAGELVLDEQLEKLEVRERGRFGLRDPRGQGLDNAGQAYGYHGKPSPVLLTSQKFNQYLAEEGLRPLPRCGLQKGRPTLTRARTG